MHRRVKMYSRHGCNMCKQRKKKCDEGRPACSSCTRHKLVCSYDHYVKASSNPRGLVVLGTFEPANPSYEAEAISTDETQDDAEKSTVGQIVQKLPLFWASTSSETSQNLQELRQMISQCGVVRTAVVACFSDFLSDREDAEKVKYQAFGQSLNLLQKKLASTKPDHQDVMQVKLAMNFIGMMEALNPTTDVDLLAHWKAVATYTERWQQIDVYRRKFWKEYLLCQESLLFHVSILSMFSEHFEYIYTVWQKAEVCLNLEALNPEGPNRVPNSILLSGQYPVFNMALQVTYLLRSRQQVSSDKLNEMMTTVSAKNQVLEHDFGLSTHTNPEARAKFALCKTYHVFCSALQICILCLHDADERNIERLDTLESESLAGLGELRSILETLEVLRRAHILWVLLWPLQIVACATRKDSDLDNISRQFTVYSHLLDKGSCQRTKALFERIRQARKEAEDEADQNTTTDATLPSGLALLRKPGGVLA